MSLLLTLLSNILRKFSMALKVASLRFSSEDSWKRIVVKSATQYDMSIRDDEFYYSQQYLEFLRITLNGTEPRRILDLGCGSGRLSNQLAAIFPKAEIVGCDISETTVLAARRNSKSEGNTNTTYKYISIDEQLKRIGRESQDLVILTEVAFYYSNWASHLERIMEVLCTGGLFACSVRSRYYTALHAVQNDRFESCTEILNSNTGAIFGSTLDFTWYSTDEAVGLIESTPKMEVVFRAAIGALSGIPGDPNFGNCQPSTLSGEERRQLMEVELALGQKYPDSGRYIFLIAVKR